MLNIINHKGNANQNHDSYHYTCQDSHYQKNPNKQSTNTTVSVSKDVEKWEHLCTVDEDVKWFSCYGKQCGGSSKHSKQNYYVIQPFHFWIFIQRIEIRISKRQIFALLRSLPPYSQWLRGGSNLLSSFSTPSLTLPTTKLFSISIVLQLKNVMEQDFPGGPLVKTLSSHCRGPRCDPWSGNQIAHVTAKNSHATTKDPACLNQDPSRPK